MLPASAGDAGSIAIAATAAAHAAARWNGSSKRVGAIGTFLELVVPESVQCGCQQMRPVLAREATR
jgi:hypothetical protein